MEENRLSIKKFLLDKLKQEHCFWSYEVSSIQELSDDLLIENTLRYLDLDEINLLFQLYSYKKIKNVWLTFMVPQGEYLYTLNRFFAWYYFKVKRPDTYLKSMETKLINRLCS